MNKKMFFSLLLVESVCMATFSQSSDRFHQETVSENEPKSLITGGVLLETNLSNYLHSGAGDGKSRMKAGFTVGGFMNLGMNKSFSVQGEMLFHYKNSDFEWSDQRGSFRYWGIEIPIYAMYHYHFSKGNRLFIGIGPYTEFGVDAVFKHNGKKSDLYEKNENSDLAPLRDSNTGFGVKIGYEFISGFQLNATYKASITNQLDENSSSIKMHPQAVSIGVAYRFGQ